jgi:hypothetical protein
MKWFIAIVVAAIVLYELVYLYKCEVRSTHIYKLTRRLNAAYQDCTNQDFTKRDFSGNGFLNGNTNMGVIYSNYTDGTQISFSKDVDHIGGRDFSLFLILWDPSMMGVLSVTTNHIFIWADAHYGAEIVDENHKPPLFTHLWKSP